MSAVVVKVLMCDLKRNYFELFNLQTEFSIDQRKLKSIYLEFSKKYHPDVCDNVLYYQHIVDAYNTLSNAFLRANYLLALNNLEVKDYTIDDIDFLEQQLFWQEQLANNSKNTQTLEHLYQNVKNFNQQTEIEFEHFYKHKDFKQAKAATLRLQFLDKLLHKIDEAISNNL